MSIEPGSGGAATLNPGRLLLSAALLLALGAAGWLTVRQFSGAAEPAAAASPVQNAAPAEQQSMQAPPAIAVPVQTATARRGDLVMRISATGNAEATRQLDVTPIVPGTIVELPIEEGQTVSAGDLLIRLDDTELALARQKARERLVQAMARFQEKRMFLEGNETDSEILAELRSAEEAVLEDVMSPDSFRSLIDDPKFEALFGSITRDEVMAAQDGLLTSRAEYAEAELALERARVLAPFGGQVARITAVEGQRVGAGTTLLTLVDADPLRVRVKVLESEAGLVRVGRQARVRFTAYPGEEFSGRIETVSPLVDPDTKTLEVVVALPNGSRRLKPGMFAQITLDTRIFEDRVLVPSTAVLLRDDRPMLFIVRDGRSEWVYIEKGRDNGDDTEVLDGVQPGDEVIVSGHYSLAHDAAVRVVTADSSSPN